MRAIPKYSSVVLYVLLLSLRGLPNINAGVTSDYKRPPSRPLLPLEHECLARPIGASPHVPEQVHLSLAGPGSMAVSWLTYPQVNTTLLSYVASVTCEGCQCYICVWLSIVKGVCSTMQ